MLSPSLGASALFDGTTGTQHRNDQLRYFGPRTVEQRLGERGGCRQRNDSGGNRSFHDVGLHPSLPSAQLVRSISSGSK